MSFFLFVKQIVDMLYMYKLLDYFMVGVVAFMLVYQIMLIRPDLKAEFTLADAIVIVLSIFVTVGFLKKVSEYETYFKVLSAFLLFFMGRVYYERIQECYGALVCSSYVIVYINLFARFINFNGKLLQVTNAGGDLYYYDTDMAFAMILAFTFITMFGKNCLLKLFTVLFVCPYMVLYSDAGIQKALLLVVAAVMSVYIVELASQNKKFANILLIAIVFTMILVIVFIYLPIVGVNIDRMLNWLIHTRIFSYENMQSRYLAWEKIIQLNKMNGKLSEIFGCGLSVRIAENICSESMYIKMYYVLGWSGLLLAIGLLVSVVRYILRAKERKTIYLMIMVLVLFLGSGVTINCMERVQMSWFPLMFAGMVVSSVRKENVEEKVC